MRIFSPVRASGVASALPVGLGGQVVVLADDPPSGEMWRQTVPREMAGMSMPPRTLKVCVPQGRAAETLSKPQGPGMGDNCTLQDARHDGNRFSAKFMCSGRQQAQGRVASVFAGNHASTTMTLQTNGQSITVKTESQKLGTPGMPIAAPATK